VPRRTRNELEAEFFRLYEVCEIADEFSHKRGLDGDWTPPKSPTAREWMEGCLRQGATMSQIVAGAWEAVDDNLAMFEELSKDFVAFYNERTGRDFYREFSDPARRAKAILKRGRIEDDTEFRLLTEILSNVEQTIFTPRQAERAEALLFAYEDSSTGDD